MELQGYSSSSSSSDDDLEICYAVMSVVQLMKHVVDPPSPITKRTSVERERDAANTRLMRDYFSEPPRYTDPKVFRRRFRMSKRLFLRICEDLKGKYDYFQQRRDARGKLGFTAIQKCTAAVRMLGHGNTADFNDDYLQMTEKTMRDNLEHFAQGIIEVYGPRYLRKPTWHDLRHIYDVHEEVHGLVGMIGSIDCMHWQWSNCPSSWRGQHTRADQKGPTLILQAVASCDLWIWHAFFDADVNILEQSPIIEDRIAGNGADACFFANDNEYPYGYYLASDMYPDYSIFVKSIRDSVDERRAHFKKVQESARKDIERAFGILKARWHFVRNPCRTWRKEKIRDVMYACIILHNMILEDGGKAYCQNYQPEQVEAQTEADMEERLENAEYMRSKEVHNSLMADMVTATWFYRDRSAAYD